MTSITTQQNYIEQTKSQKNATLKRLFDLLVCVNALPFLSVIMIVLSIVIWVIEGKFPFQSVSYHGVCSRPFNMVQFNVTNPHLYRFLHNTGLGLLPQFINILKGDMSLVGPRPITTSLVVHTPKHLMHLEVQPGLTGFWYVESQQNSRGKAFLKYDIEYLENRTLRLDLNILYRTLNMAFE